MTPLLSESMYESIGASGRVSDCLMTSTLTDRECAFVGSSGYVSHRQMASSYFQTVRMCLLEHWVVFLTV
jgi:hypothetical protein